MKKSLFLFFESFLKARRSFISPTKAIVTRPPFASLFPLWLPALVELSFPICGQKDNKFSYLLSLQKETSPAVARMRVYYRYISLLSRINQSRDRAEESSVSLSPYKKELQYGFCENALFQVIENNRNILGIHRKSPPAKQKKNSEMQWFSGVALEFPPHKNKTMEQPQVLKQGV